MFDHVIVPTDGSDQADRALGAAAVVAERLGAAIVLLRASHPDDLDQSTEELKERALRLEAPDAELILDSANDPVGAIVEAVRSHPRSLVCMATHGRGGVGRALFGSVAEGALNEALVPFVLVGPHVDTAAPQLGDVVVPLDGSHRAESILPVVTQWARATDAALWLVEVVDPKDEATVAATGQDLSEEAYVERIAAGLPDDLRSVDWDVLHGSDPATAIREYAGENDLPVIALATHGHSGLSRIVAGSVASRIVHDHAGITLVIRTADPED